MKQYYFLKLTPPRPTFVQDMTDDEKALMQKHVVYLTEQMAKGLLHVFGPVLDPQGPFGMAVACVDDPSQLQELIANDPANGLNRYESFPMRAVVPSK